jgi:probable HAF family extracellular repeat protein
MAPLKRLASNPSFLWEKGEKIDLGTLGGTHSTATDINNRGQIVGGSNTSSGPHHAFLWENEEMIDLGTLGGMFSRAHAINERGEIVGSSRNSSGELYPTLWKRRTGKVD